MSTDQREAGTAWRVKTRAAMLERTGQPDCPACGYPDGERREPPGGAPCLDRWHQQLEELVAGAFDDMAGLAEEPVAHRFSSRRWQMGLMRGADPHQRAAFRARMAEATGAPDCLTCGWPLGIGVPGWHLERIAARRNGQWAPGCLDPWHRVAEGVIWDLKGNAVLALTGGHAVFSPDRRHRYLLSRRWRHDGPTVGWLMLNPSVADAGNDDPTVRKCIGFSRAWGFAGMMIWNLQALVATDPRELRRNPGDAFGPDNQRYLEQAATAPLLVCAWGDNADREHAAWVGRLMSEWGAIRYHLGRTAKGNPRHPGRIAYASELQPW